MSQAVVESTRLAEAEIAALRKRLGDLLFGVGRPCICGRCEMAVVAVQFQNGQRHLYDPDGARHCGTCPR